MSDPREYWNEHYRKQGQMEDLPNCFLQEMMPRLQTGKVLDVAMGAGTNSVFLAKNGFSATGFDISEEAIELAKAKAQNVGVEIDARVLDASFFVMRPMEYDSIIMLRYRPDLDRFFSEMIRGLKQGGTILIESTGFGKSNEGEATDEQALQYHFSVNEVLRKLQGLTILYYQETTIDEVPLVQCLACKPAESDSLKYDVLGMASSGGDQPSHTVSADQERKNKQMELAERLFRK